MRFFLLLLCFLLHAFATEHLYRKAPDLSSVLTFFLQTIDKYSENKEEFVHEILNIQKSLLVDLEATDLPEFTQTGFLTIQMSPEYLNRFLQRNGTMIVAKHQEQIIGYLLLDDICEYIDWVRGRRFDSEWNLNQLFSKREGKYIDQIAVLASYAKQGIGTALVNQAKQLSPHGLFTDILFEPYPNTASSAFFSKMGFLNVGVIYVDETSQRPAHKISLMLWSPLASN